MICPLTMRGQHKGDIWADVDEELLERGAHIIVGQIVGIHGSRVGRYVVDLVGRLTVIRSIYWTCDIEGAALHFHRIMRALTNLFRIGIGIPSSTFFRKVNRGIYIKHRDTESSGRRHKNGICDVQFLCVSRPIIEFRIIRCWRYFKDQILR